MGTLDAELTITAGAASSIPSNPSSTTHPSSPSISNPTRSISATLLRRTNKRMPKRTVRTSPYALEGPGAAFRAAASHCHLSCNLLASNSSSTLASSAPPPSAPHPPFAPSVFPNPPSLSLPWPLPPHPHPQPPHSNFRPHSPPPSLPPTPPCPNPLPVPLGCPDSPRELGQRVGAPLDRQRRPLPLPPPPSRSPPPPLPDVDCRRKCHTDLCLICTCSTFKKRDINTRRCLICTCPRTGIYSLSLSLSSLSLSLSLYARTHAHAHAHPRARTHRHTHIPPPHLGPNHPYLSYPRRKISAIHAHAALTPTKPSSPLPTSTPSTHTPAPPPAPCSSPCLPPPPPIHPPGPSTSSATPCTPGSAAGTRSMGGERGCECVMNKTIQRNTPIPTKKSQIFSQLTGGDTQGW